MNKCMIITAAMIVQIYSSTSCKHDESLKLLSDDSQGNQSAGIFQRFESKKIKNMVVDAVLIQEKKIDVGLLDFDLADGVNSAFDYTFRVKNSPNAGYKSRIDQYKLNLGITPGDTISAEGLTFGLNLQQGTQLTFVRQVRNDGKFIGSAEKLVPYTIMNLPITAARAIEKLNSGDFVEIMASMNIMVNASAMATTGIVGLGVGAKFILSGQFRLQVFRLINNYVRLKIIAVRENTVEVSQNVSFLGGLKITGLEIIDDNISKLIALTPQQMSVAISKQDVFISDYVFNLENPEAIRLYNNILNPKRVLTAVKDVGIFFNTDDIKKRLISDLSAVESFSLAQILKHPTEPKKRAVDRKFNGSARSKTMTNSFKFDLNLISFENSQVFKENRIVRKVLNTTGQDTKEYYLFPTFTDMSKTGFLFKLFTEDTLSSASMLFTSNSLFQPQSFEGMGFRYFQQNVVLTLVQTGKIVRHLKTILPEEYFSKIDLGDWGPKTNRSISNPEAILADFQTHALDKIPRNVRISHSYHLNARSLGEIVSNLKASGADNLTKKIFTKLVRYMEIIPSLSVPQTDKLRQATTSKLKRSGVANRDDFRKWGEMTNLEKLSPNNIYTLDRYIIAHRLAIVFDRMTNNDRRLKTFSLLRRNAVFREIGSGFLISLLPGDPGQFLSFDMKWTADNREPLEFHIGNGSRSEVYRSLQEVESVLSQHSSQRVGILEEQPSN